MFILRVQLPELPGTLGRIATAIGAAGADIQALEIVGHGDGFAIDDFVVDLPGDVLADTVVAACQSVDDVRVLWVSRSQGTWTIASDVEVLDAMTANPSCAKTILLSEAPNLFHCAWAMLANQDRQVLAATQTAPVLNESAWEDIGALSSVRTVELPSEWLPEWGETIVAIAPMGADQAILIGRQGGPSFLRSELTRLKYLARLATV
ncbi:MAG: amino acid-binding protein [Propionibacteriaceae bacterium]|jgi:hypothetical protein|nr:amino acid-binding protein [Propionibacteriaceae bacterium]